jgi:hypothetical protein
MADSSSFKCDRWKKSHRRHKATAAAGVAVAFPIHMYGLDGSIIGTVKPYEPNDPRKGIICDYLIDLVI